MDRSGSVCDFVTKAQVNFSLFMFITSFLKAEFNNSRKKMVAFNRKINMEKLVATFFFFNSSTLCFVFFFFLLNINCFCFDGYRLGFVIDFLSKATLVGFMSGAAVIVSLQQLKGLLGISHFTSKMQFIPVMSSVFKHRDEASGIIKCKEAFVRIQK